MSRLSSSPSPRAPSSVAGSDQSLGTRSKLQTLAIETLLSTTLSSVASAPPRLPVAKNKEPLSLPTTTRNFRGFVQKSGPIFYFQDAVEATLMWDDWPWTAMWMAIWALVALHPYLLLCAPSAILCIILIRTHQARFPVGRPAAVSQQPHSVTGEDADEDGLGNAEEAVRSSPSSKKPATVEPSGLLTPSPAQSLRHAMRKPTSTGEGAVRPPLVPNPPHEGTIKYYENLRDIQNMMKMVTDGYDAGAPLVPFLNWSSYRRTLLLLQASLLTTALLFLFGPYLPIRPVLLLAGEGAFIANHPWLQPALSGVMKRLSDEKTTGRTPLGRELRRMEARSRALRAKFRIWVEEDGLDDVVWQKGWKDVEMFENERFVSPDSPGAAAGTAGWSAHNLTFGERKPFTKGADGWSAEELEVAGFSLDISRQVAMALEPGWAWVEGDDWRIDWVGVWSGVGVDEDGYVYTDADWQSPAPFQYGHKNHPAYPPPASGRSVANGGSTGGGSAIAEDSDEENDEDGVSGLTGLEVRRAKAETRRRRWLRRAIWVGHDQ